MWNKDSTPENVPYGIIFAHSAGLGRFGVRVLRFLDMNVDRRKRLRNLRWEAQSESADRGFAIGKLRPDVSRLPEGLPPC
jgi:hypothetical protein